MKTRVTTHKNVELLDMSLAGTSEASVEGGGAGPAQTRAWHGDGVRLPMAPPESNLMTRTARALTAHTPDPSRAHSE